MIEPGEIISTEETDTHVITKYIHANGAKVITKVPKVVSDDIIQHAVNTLYECAAVMYGVDSRCLKIII